MRGNKNGRKAERKGRKARGKGRKKRNRMKNKMVKETAERKESYKRKAHGKQRGINEGGALFTSFRPGLNE